MGTVAGNREGARPLQQVSICQTGNLKETLKFLHTKQVFKLKYSSQQPFFGCRQHSNVNLRHVHLDMKQPFLQIEVVAQQPFSLLR